MKAPIRLWVLLIAACLWACAPGVSPPTTPVKMAPGDALFAKAEAHFQDREFDQALAAYQEYLARFPGRAFADAALMQIGAIYLTLGKTTEARQTYQRLLSEYPDSHLVGEARIGLLTTFYQEGDYSEVIRRAGEIPERSLPRGSLFKLQVLLGDTQLAQQHPLEAINAYGKAMRLAESADQQYLRAKLQDVAVLLESEDIATLLPAIDDPPVRALLMYQLGIKYFENEKYEDALRVLTAFTEQYPQDPNAPIARNLMNELAAMTTHKRQLIGCLLPLSGAYQKYGERALKGIELALTQFNTPGGAAAMELLVKDTASDPATAIQAVRDLAAEKVAAIIGPLATAEPAAQAAQENEIPIVTLTQKDHIPDIGGFVFRNFITPLSQAQTLAAYAVETLGLTRFAVMYPNENYGTTYMNLFWDALIPWGGKIVRVEDYEPGQTDFADVIQKLVGQHAPTPPGLRMGDGPPRPLEGVQQAAWHPNTPRLTRLIKPAALRRDPDNRRNDAPQVVIDFEAIFIPDAASKVGLIIPQLLFHDIENVFLLGTNLWHSQKLIDMAGPYAQGAVLVDGFFAESPSPQVVDFVNVFENTYQEKPGYIEAVSYDTAMILFTLAANPDIRSRADLQDALIRLQRFEGVTGRTSFLPNGEVDKKLYILQIAGDKFIQLERP